MFKGILSLLLLAAAILPASAQTSKTPIRKMGITLRSSATAAATGTNSQYTAFDFNWAFTPNLPICTTANVACYDGFQVTNTTLGTVIGTPAQIGPTLRSWVYTPAAGIPYGTTAFSMVAHGFDEAGASIVSVTPATVSVTVKVTSLNGPTALQVVAQ